MKLTNESISTLKQCLSPEASINFPQDEVYKITAARWSDYKAPRPGAVVNVACESDIEKTVAWATANGAKFVAQSGGHGMSTTYSIGPEDIIINLRKMNSVNIDLERGIATLGGGTIVEELIAEAHKHKAQVPVGICNSVGVLGATLGGGFGRCQGLYGLGVDNMLSARVITAEGKAINVSADEHSDLWWGLRGAGHNFGIVSSLTMTVYPQTNGGVHWMGLGVYMRDTIPALTKAINGLDWSQGMTVNLFFTAAPPEGKPAIVISTWYPGAEEPAMKAFSGLLAAGPVFQQNEMTAYDHANDGSNPLGAKGGNKPFWSTSMMRLNAAALQEAWELYIAFITENPSAMGTFLLVEFYSMEKVKQVPVDEMAFPHRVAPVHVVICPIYEDPSIAPAAEAFGAKSCSVLQAASGCHKNEVYVNFCYGDEPLNDKYGDEARLEKLRALKKKWDPKGCFNHYNPIL